MVQPDGLYGKFDVHRVDRRDLPGGDRENARYFVLDYVHDPGAMVALEAYIGWAYTNGYRELALDLETELEEVRNESNSTD